MYATGGPRPPPPWGGHGGEPGRNTHQLELELANFWKAKPGNVAVKSISRSMDVFGQVERRSRLRFKNHYK